MLWRSGGVRESKVLFETTDSELRQVQSEGSCEAGLQRDPWAVPPLNQEHLEAHRLPEGGTSSPLWSQPGSSTHAPPQKLLSWKQKPSSRGTAKHGSFSTTALEASAKLAPAGITPCQVNGPQPQPPKPPRRLAPKEPIPCEASEHPPRRPYLDLVQRRCSLAPRPLPASRE